MRVYVVANDRMVENFMRFRDYYSVFMPDASLHVIPFDDQIVEIRALLQTLDKCVLVDADPTVDWIGQQIFGDEDYRPQIRAWRYFRKLNAFLGHKENFVFLDINAVVLANLKILFNNQSSNEFGIYFGARSLPYRSIKDQFSKDFLKTINPGLDVGYNSGLIASRGGLFDLEFGRRIARRALRSVIGKAPEQGFLTLYIGFTGLRHGLLSDLRDDFATISNRAALEDKDDGFLRVCGGPENGRLKLVLKYSGQSLIEEPEIIKAFYRKAVDAVGRKQLDRAN